MDDIETICANSFRNFHTKGFDYLCLSRTPELTRKIYFFDGELSQLPELVMPHDHRYAFVTTVLSGAVRNKTFTPLPGIRPELKALAPLYDRFEYRTPLNGGDGFAWVREEHVREHSGGVYTRGRHYRSERHHVHTLDIRCEGTVIMLEQLADEVPMDAPTSAWRRAGDRTPPNLDGLYERMAPDHARLRIGQFLDLIGNR
ncbi:hypothetical protein [Sphingomonas asaccharolytica]|uniref:hypothetical protein n=1 Tax=Sphingomonas asaccharolytica TaxID=40681 RepID=UPI000A7901F1|nr:hypothetical protein [Sphingomonas asaccharolytica]